ncbi:MAG: dTDP-glucose 4,6-dehydratase [Candidatus Zixiibacteriota bacterium]|nr:MAG: dTDP-glucose 4,6-dehydratase [candidate division Zixibacteria bacterium]
MKLLITGGAGFIGANFVRYILETYPDYKLINYDKLTYAGNLENLAGLEDNRNYSFVRGDIADRKQVGEVMSAGVDVVLNFAAESHVDRSLEEAAVFIGTNVLGTQVLLEAALKHKVDRFVQISTDEVYGSLGPTGSFTEKTPLSPNSPYAATKAAADLMVRAYFESFSVQAIITRCSNNHGPYQFPEKLIPLFITNALENIPLPVYGDGLYIRDWIHVIDHCRALDLALHRGKPGEIYNIGGGDERTNLEITKLILKHLKKSESLITHVKDRPGHDRRYAIDCSKLKRELGFETSMTLEDGLKQTMDWYIQNRSWWEKVRSGEYREYYHRHYADREKTFER